MHGPAKPPIFDERAWAQFDFRRWHVDGLPIDALPAAVADLAQRLFGSDEWRQHFQASLPEVARGVLDGYREHARHLEEEKKAIARDFDSRLAGARTRSEEFGKAMEEAAAPSLVEPDPQTYHLSVRVAAARDARLGLPGLVVQVTTPGDKAVLGQAETDRDGNALLALPTTAVGEGVRAEAMLEVLTVDGKSLLRLPDALRIRPNQVETKVLSIKDSADTASVRDIALELRSVRERRAREITTDIDRLARERDAQLRDLELRLDMDRRTIAEIESTVPPGPPDTKTPPKPAGGRSEKEQAAASKKKRGKA